MSEHRYDIRISESCVDLNPWKVERQDPDNCFLFPDAEKMRIGNSRTVEREMSVFWDNHALPDTSMRLSDYVLQTFLVNIFSLAIANFSIFKMANGNFKMAAKFIC